MTHPSAWHSDMESKAEGEAEITVAHHSTHDDISMTDLDHRSDVSILCTKLAR
jgi:hypothetical protein